MHFHRMMFVQNLTKLSVSTILIVTFSINLGAARFNPNTSCKNFASTKFVYDVIENVKNKGWKHKINKLEVLLRKANSHVREANQVLNKINYDFIGNKTVPASVKSNKSAKEKLARFEATNRGAEDMMDILRGAIVFEHKNNLYAALGRIAKHYEISNVKDYFKEPKGSGYRAVHVLIRLPESGFIFEIQLHVKDLYEIKTNKAAKNLDDVYHEFRNLLYQHFEAMKRLSELEGIEQRHEEFIKFFIQSQFTSKDLKNKIWYEDRLVTIGAYLRYFEMKFRNISHIELTRKIDELDYKLDEINDIHKGIYDSIWKKHLYEYKHIYE